MGVELRQWSPVSDEVELTVPIDPPPLAEPTTATAPKSLVSAKHVAIGLLGIVAVAVLLVVSIVVLSRNVNSPSPPQELKKMV